MQLENSDVTTERSIRYYLNWAKARIDEMDATLASLEATIGELQADARQKGQLILANLRNKRDDFYDTVTKQAISSEADWLKAKASLETDWNYFEAGVKKYLENIDKKIQQRQVTFKLQAEAQIKAWREAVGELSKTADQFAAERRSEIDAAVERMNADAAAAEEKLQKLNQAGSESWSIFTDALAETRATFDRANQAVSDAFKRAST